MSDAITNPNLERLPPAMRATAWSKDDPNRPTKQLGPTGPHLKTILKKVLTMSLDLDDPITREKYQMTIGEALMLQLVKRGLEGNLSALSLILDRIDGKITDKLDVNSTITAKPQFDLSKLSGDELDKLRSTMSRISDDEEPEEAPVIIDVVEQVT